LPDDFSQFSLAATETNVENISTIENGVLAIKIPSTLDEVERLQIMATLRYTEGNKLRAAEILGIGRYSLYRKAERLGIDLDAWHQK
jgi:DNA-binding NtrC family response regulator